MTNKVERILEVAEQITSELFIHANGIDVLYDLLSNDWVKDYVSHKEYAVELLGFEPSAEEMNEAYKLIQSI